MSNESEQQVAAVEQRCVVVQGVPPTWTKDDVVKYFSKSEGSIERITYFPRKAMALMTMATVEATKEAITLHNVTPPGEGGPLTVEVTARKANVNTDGMNKVKKRNRVKNTGPTVAEKRPLEEAPEGKVEEKRQIEQAEHTEAPVQQGEKDAGAAQIAKADELAAEVKPAVEAVPEVPVPEVPEGDLPVMPVRKRARKDKTKKQRESSLLSFIDEP